MVVVEHQQGLGQRGDGDRRQFGVVEQVDQWLDVVTAEHGAEQFGGVFAVDQRRAGFALGDGGQEGGFDIGGIVNARWDAVGEQLDQGGFFTCDRFFQKFNQISGLFCIQGQRRQAFGGACGGVLAIGF